MFLLSIVFFFLTPDTIMKDAETLQVAKLFGSADGATADPALVSKKASFRATLGLSESPTPPTSSRLPPFPSILGHRGALYAELENTIPAFVQCAAWGCAGVELDAFVLKDGSIVVFHGAGTDEGPGYLTDYCIGKKGVNIMDLTYEETQQLRFNPSFDEFPCDTDKITTARIPLLSDVLQALRGTGMDIKIELKSSDTVLPVLKTVEELGMTKMCSYSSFDHSRLLALRKLRPNREEYPTGALFNKALPDDFLERAKACGATEVHFCYDSCTVERIEAARKAGFGTMAWLRGPRGMTEDCKQLYEDIKGEDLACYQALWETGVDKVCCNRPNLALRLRDAMAPL